VIPTVKSILNQSRSKLIRQFKTCDWHQIRSKWQLKFQQEPALSNQFFLSIHQCSFYQQVINFKESLLWLEKAKTHLLSNLFNKALVPLTIFSFLFLSLKKWQFDLNSKYKILLKNTQKAATWSDNLCMCKF